MRVILCTLAVCLSLLAAVFTIQELIRAEGRRIRAAIPKALCEPADGQESVMQRLDDLSAQAASLGKRLAQLEEKSSKPPAPAADDTPGALLSETRALASAVRGVAASQARLEGVPRHLAELTTYFDRSFSHLEKKIAEGAPPDAPQAVALSRLATRVDTIDRYFTPLYAFLGLVYDPGNEDLLADYPSVDVRLNALAADLRELRDAVADLRKRMPVPIVIEPTKHPR